MVAGQLGPPGVSDGPSLWGPRGARACGCGLSPCGTGRRGGCPARALSRGKDPDVGTRGCFHTEATCALNCSSFRYVLYGKVIKIRFLFSKYILSSSLLFYPKVLA